MNTREIIESGKFHPVAGKLLARIDKVQSKGLIILPTSAQWETSTATVIEVGADLPDYLKPGVRVLPHEASGLAVCEEDNVRYVVYELKDLQAVFDNPSEEELKEFFEGREK